MSQHTTLSQHTIGRPQHATRWAIVAHTTALAILCGLTGITGCWSAPDREVVVYAALDREFSQPALDQFAEQEKCTVSPKFDIESTKTVGLVNEILAEKNRPRCDVFWNNEILHTLRLQRQGMLEPYRSPQAEQFPESFRSPDGAWYGLAARARVLLVNTDRVPIDQRPDSVSALADPRWKGRTGLAKPLFGTTASHAAVLFAKWGDDRARTFFSAVQENAQVLSGNKQVAISVGRGQLDWGLTDTDDAIAEVEAGSPVAIVFPDQGQDQPGTLLIPNTIGIIKGCRHPELARQLIDFLLSETVETQLARGASAQFPLRKDLAERPRVAPSPTPRWMEVDFAAAADKWESAAEFLNETFRGS